MKKRVPGPNDDDGNDGNDYNDDDDNNDVNDDRLIRQNFEFQQQLGHRPELGQN